MKKKWKNGDKSGGRRDGGGRGGGRRGGGGSGHYTLDKVSTEVPETAEQNEGGEGEGEIVKEESSVLVTEGMCTAPVYDLIPILSCSVL